MEDVLIGSAEENDILWEDLISQVMDRRVVPIVGPELLQVPHDGQTRPLHELLAAHLVDELRLDRSALPTLSLDEVAAHYLSDRRGKRSVLYTKMKNFLAENRFPPPKPLCRLARIEELNLFVSTTFDPFLKSAIDGIRFGGKDETIPLAYSTNTETPDIGDRHVPDDLESVENLSLLEAPFVYQLFGKLAPAANYVLTEHDVLEFFVRLHDERYQPRNLFERLRESCLLIIGCNFPNWLARFFLRLMSEHGLQDRGLAEIIADGSTRQDPKLAVFLGRANTIEYLRSASAPEFVEEFYRRWCREKGVPEQDETSLSAEPVLATRSGPEPGSVFLSYASEDRDLVRKLSHALRASGLPAWFDESRLEAGDRFNEEIQGAIDTCSAFVPCISKNTASETRYVRREWLAALARADSESEAGKKLLYPVIIDDTDNNDPSIPGEIRQQYHITRCPGGVPPRAFLEVLKRAVASRQELKRSAS